MQFRIQLGATKRSSKCLADAILAETKKYSLPRLSFFVLNLNP